MKKFKRLHKNEERKLREEETANELVMSKAVILSESPENEGNVL